MSSLLNLNVILLMCFSGFYQIENFDDYNYDYNYDDYNAQDSKMPPKTNEMIEHMLRTFCNTPEAPDAFDERERHHLYPEALLETAVEPRCLHKCLETSKPLMKSFELCERMSDKCKDCMQTCLSAKQIIESNINSKIQKISWNCDDFCGVDGSKSCKNSCDFIVENFQSRSDVECPTPYDVSMFDYYHRDICRYNSLCYYDTHCRRRTQKCCPSRTGARFCVNVPEEALELRSQEAAAANAATGEFVKNATSETETVEETKPDNFYEPDSFFVNFKTHVTQRGRSLVIHYKYDPKEYNLAADVLTIALLAWKSHLNFTENATYSLMGYDTYQEGHFTLELDPGWQYLFKLGAYDSNGLIGSKADCVKNAVYTAEEELDLNVVTDMQVDFMDCKMRSKNLHQCKVALSWKTNQTGKSHPVHFQVHVSSCSDYPEQTKTVSGKSGGLSATFELKVCDSLWHATVITKATVFASNGTEKNLEDEPRTFDYRLQNNPHFCHKGPKISSLSIGNLSQTVVGRDIKSVQFAVNVEKFQELVDSMSYDWIHVSVTSFFCTCLTDKPDQMLSFYFPVNHVNAIKMQLNKRCAYMVSVKAVESKHLSRCQQLSKGLVIPPSEYFGDLPTSLGQKVEKVFPSNIRSDIFFNGVLEIEFWSLNRSKVIHEHLWHQSMGAITTVKFAVRCSEEVFVMIRHGKDHKSLPSCANSAYRFNSVSWCLSDEDYFNTVASMHKSRQLLIEPLLSVHWLAILSALVFIYII